MAWTLQGIISSQLGDVETKIVGPGFEGTVKEYIEESLGYGPGMIGVSAVVAAAFSVFFFGIFAFSLKVLNFQNRWYWRGTIAEKSQGKRQKDSMEEKHFEVLNILDV